VPKPNTRSKYGRLAPWRMATVVGESAHRRREVSGDRSKRKLVRCGPHFGVAGRQGLTEVSAPRWRNRGGGLVGARLEERQVAPGVRLESTRASQ
jgi:hypothetical protein